jgi:hypothetical protein
MGKAFHQKLFSLKIAAVPSLPDLRKNTHRMSILSSDASLFAAGRRDCPASREFAGGNNKGGQTPKVRASNIDESKSPAFNSMLCRCFASPVADVCDYAARAGTYRKILMQLSHFISKRYMELLKLID